VVKIELQKGVQICWCREHAISCSSDGSSNAKDGNEETLPSRERFFVVGDAPGD